MSKTPRTDEVLKSCEQHTSDVGIADLHKMYEHAIKLETELADMREQFAEYVQAEDDWRDARIDDRVRSQLMVKASELRLKADLTLRLS